MTSSLLCNRSNRKRAAIDRFTTIHCVDFIMDEVWFHFFRIKIPFDWLFSLSKMTLVFLEQLPLPSLKTYVTVSFLLFVSSCLYAINTIWNSNEVNTEDLKEKPETTIYDFMTADNFCFWVSYLSWWIYFYMRLILYLSFPVFWTYKTYCSFFSVEFEHGLLLSVYIRQNYTKSRLWWLERSRTPGTVYFHIVLFHLWSILFEKVFFYHENVCIRSYKLRTWVRTCNI